MDAAQRSFQLQAQVRQNAEIVKNTLNDLYNWEKEIKDAEKKILSQPPKKMEEQNLTTPVRSHIKESDAKKPPADSLPSEPTNHQSNGIDKYDSAGEKEEALKDPLELKHKKANEIKDRGNKLVRLSEYDKAIEEYTQAIELYDNDAVYYSNRALCYLKLERYDECIEDCEHAIDIDRLAVKAYYRRMMANESLGNNIDALKDCTTILMIEPKNIEAKRSLDRINERLRKNIRTPQGSSFTPLRPDLNDILPIDKPAYKRSTKPLRRIPIADVIGPKESKNLDNLTISDEDIDKLFNSNCGYFEEIKGPINKEDSLIVPKESEEVNQEEPLKIDVNEREKLPVATEKENSNKIKTEDSNIRERPLPPAPTSTGQFYSNWKKLTPEQKYNYLKSIPLKQLSKILGAGFDSETLSDIINTLHDFYLLEKDACIANMLLEVSKNKQVSILSLLMSNEEREVLTKIIKSLEETNALDAALAEQIIKNFSLN